MTRGRSDGAHNAQYQQTSTRVIVQYPFHPRVSEELLVVGRQRHCGELSYVGRQPDGTLALIPIWMTEQASAAMEVVETPRIPLPCLRALQRELMTLLSFLDGDSGHDGGNHAAQAAQTRPAGPVLESTPATKPSARGSSAGSAAGRRATSGSGKTFAGGGS